MLIPRVQTVQVEFSVFYLNLERDWLRIFIGEGFISGGLLMLAMMKLRPRCIL
jgi:hypothetical protein